MNIRKAFRTAYDTLSGKTAREAQDKAREVRDEFQQQQGLIDFAGDQLKRSNRSLDEINARIDNQWDNTGPMLDLSSLYDSKEKRVQDIYRNTNIRDTAVKTQQGLQDSLRETKATADRTTRNRDIARAGVVGGTGVVGASAMSNKEAMWKKDYSAERRQDALLFIKEALDYRDEIRDEDINRARLVGLAQDAISPAMNSIPILQSAPISARFPLSMGAHVLASKLHNTKGENKQHNKALRKIKTTSDMAGLLGSGVDLGMAVSNLAGYPVRNQLVRQGAPFLTGAVSREIGLQNLRRKSRHKKEASARNMRRAIVGGAALTGGAILGGKEYYDSSKLKSGVTRRKAKALARDASDAKLEELTGKKKFALSKKMQDVEDKINDYLDKNRHIGIPAKTLLGATAAGLGAHSALP